MEHEGHEHENSSVCARLEHSLSESSDDPSTFLSKHLDGKEGSKSTLDSATPEKKPDPPVSKRIAIDATAYGHNEVVEIPEKYKNIVDFFDQMICSIRLLSIRKKLITFHNISSQVEVLTKRNLQYSHLAQIKYLFPEAIEIEKILIHDKTSLCMVPELKISLSVTSIEDLCVQGKSLPSVLRQVFRSRLLDFINNHQEPIDIPEAVLPDHFNTKKQSRFEAAIEETSKEIHSPSFVNDITSSTSLLLPSLRKQFPENIMVTEANTKALPVLSVSFGLTFMDEDKFENCSLSSDCLFQTSKSIVKLSPTPKEGETQCTFETTPMKPVLSRSDLQIPTPAPKTPTIHGTNSLDGKQEMGMKQTLQSARRSLFYSPSKTATEGTSSPGEPRGKKSLNIETRNVDGDAASTDISDQEKMLATLPDVSDQEKMLARLPDVFNTIRIIFQSISSRTITKQELLHKIILHNFDIEKPDQAEELLHLIETTIPDWISAKATSTGDLVYSIERVCDIESMLAKLVDAL